MNAYFICVIVHVQMWYMYAQPYVYQIKNIYVLFICFWKWVVSPIFFKNFQVVFVWKTYFLGVFVTYFMCKLSREFNCSNFQVFQLWIEIFTSFSWVLREYFVRRVYLRKLSDPCENYQISFLKDISWDICFKLLTSSSKPLF